MTWVTLDYQTGQTASPKTFYVSSAATQTAYSAFRLSVTQNYGVLLGTGTMSSKAGSDAAAVAVAELSLCGFLRIFPPTTPIVRLPAAGPPPARPAAATMVSSLNPVPAKSDGYGRRVTDLVVLLPVIAAASSAVLSC